MKTKNENKIYYKIKEFLSNKSNLTELKDKLPEELLEEINIYYEELEFQNEELLRIRTDLENSKKHFEELYENAPVGYVTYNENLEIISVNKHFKKMTKFDFNSNKNVSLTRFIHPDKQNIFYFHTKQLISTLEQQNCLIKIVGKNRIYDVKLESNIFKENNILYLRSAIVDLTNEKITLKELQKSELKFRILYERMEQGVLYHDENGIITSANQSVSKLLGKSVENIIGKSNEDLKLKIIDNDGIIIPLNEIPYTITANTGTPVTSFTIGVYNELNENYVWLLVSSFPLTNNNKSKSFPTITTMTNITDLKEYEIKLTTKNTQLTAANNEKFVLLGEIHDRIKNNLNLIQSILQMQKIHTENNETSDVLNECINRIYTMQLVHENLYQTGKLANINIKEYILNIANYLDTVYLTGSSKIEFIFNIEKLHFTIEKVLPIGLLLNELITNSIKHAFKNKSKGKVEIELKKLSTLKDYKLTVKDNGIGLPEKYNLDEESKTLGLNLVSILLKQINAECKIIRKKGTSFEITFEM